MVMDSIENKASNEAAPKVEQSNSEIVKPSETVAQKGANAESNEPAAQDETSMKKDQIAKLFSEGYRLYVADEFEESAKKLGEATELS